MPHDILQTHLYGRIRIFIFFEGAQRSFGYRKSMRPCITFTVIRFMLYCKSVITNRTKLMIKLVDFGISKIIQSDRFHEYEDDESTENFYIITSF